MSKPSSPARSHAAKPLADLEHHHDEALDRSATHSLPVGKGGRDVLVEGSDYDDHAHEPPHDEPVHEPPHAEHTHANPGPLGLLGFGMTTILLNIHNIGWIELDGAVKGMGFALGGLAQLIAGVMEFNHGNTFGGTAFTAYGGFWWSLLVVWYVGAESKSVGCYLLFWSIFTMFMAIGTFKHNWITRIVFWSLALLFLLLAIGDFTEEEVVHKIAGAVGIVCGLSAFYSAVAQILNAEFERKLFPLT